MNSQKQFGVWMDGHNATVVGSNDADAFEVIAHVKGESAGANSNEKTGNNHEKTVETKFFKEIASHLVNATNIHITGTGQAQEKFIHYLAETPQFKNSKTAESTSNKMSDEKLVEFISASF